MSARLKSVYVTALPNIAPAGIAITQAGTGTSFPRAINEAVKAIFKDKRLKGKRLILPMKLVVTEGANDE